MTIDRHNRVTLLTAGVSLLALACGEVDVTDAGVPDAANPLVELRVTPEAPAVPNGIDVQFAAEGVREDTSTVDLTSEVTWSSDDTDTATIDATGLAETLAVGTATITATHPEAGSDTALLEVTAAELASIAVTPEAPETVLDSDQQFTAMAIFTDDSEENVTSTATWSSSDEDVALIDASGLGTSVWIGETAIKAQIGDVFGEVTWAIIAPVAGTHPAFPGETCTQLNDDGLASGDGIYWIDTDGDGDPADSFQVYCDMTADGGGWTLLGWTGDTEATPYGVPYPGFAPCPALDCLRGSVAGPQQAEELIQLSTEFAKTQSPEETMDSFGPLGDYTYAGKYTYGSMAEQTLVYAAGTCNADGGMAGSFYSLKGPQTYDASVVFLPDHLHWGSYDYSSDESSYLYSIGATGGPCASCPSEDGCHHEGYMGTWNPGQYGPYEAGSPGAHSLWVRGGPEPLLGHNPAFPGLSCKAVEDAGTSIGDGVYWIDPDGDADPSDSFEAYCDMTTDGGGWTLLTWSGDTTSGEGSGPPYPGLVPCPSLDCLRGSAAGPPQAEEIIQTGTEFAKAQSETDATMASFDIIEAYAYSGKYVYGSLADLTLSYGATDCGTVGDYATGTFHTLTGPTDGDGTTVYLSNALAYASYDYSSDTNIYLYDVGVPYAYCSGSSELPGSWMGTYQYQYGPYLIRSDGAYSLWVR